MAWNTAGLLTLAVEAGSTAVNRANLVSEIGSNTGVLPTQEAAQVVLAAHALMAPNANSGILLDGRQSEGAVITTLSDANAVASVIENTSAAAIDIKMTTYGVPEISPSEGGYGYAIERSYFSMEGAPATAGFASGDRMFVVLRITPLRPFPICTALNTAQIPRRAK